MGGQQSRKRDETLDLLNSYNLDRKETVSEKEFTIEVFKRLDNNANHTTAGPIIVTQTYILKAFYHYLKDQKKGAVSKDKLNDTIKKMYDQPQKSIKYSHLIISSNRENLSKHDFITFIDRSLDHGIKSIIKRNKYDANFQKGINEWLQQNKPKMMSCVETIFKQNAKSNLDYWTLGDFKRWILQKDHWTLYIQIKNVAYRIPLNIPCLLGIRLEKSEK